MKAESEWAKEKLRPIFTKIGPEAVARGITATSHNWSSCFWSRVADQSFWAASHAYMILTRTFIGLSDDEIDLVVRWWDQGSMALIKSEALLWLEEQHQNEMLAHALTGTALEPALGKEVTEHTALQPA